MKKTLCRLVALATFGVAVAAGCSHEIQSPAPSADARPTPDLVCNDVPASSPVSNVTLHGKNFTPMPSKTLEDKPQLILPTIYVQQIAPIDQPALTKPLKIFDDPAHPETSRVHWVSEQEMSFDIKPEDNFPTGTFTTTVTNPDGRSSTKFDKPVAVIPKPEILMIEPPAICYDETDDTVTIQGKYFLTYNGTEQPTVTVTAGSITKTYQATVDPASCTPIAGDFAETDIQLCTTLTFTIGAMDFPVTMNTPGKVVVTNPAPADCSSSEDIILNIDVPPRVDAVVPSTICQGGSQITVHGEGFVDGATVSLDCGGTITDATGTMVSSDGTTVTGTFGPTSAAVGDMCDVIVTNPDGCQDRPLPHKQVTVTSGPILFFVDPPVVFNGINTRITLYATTITPPLPPDAVTMVPTGQTMPVTQLAYNTVVNHPNRLQAIVPTGQAPGTYDITLKDSSGCFATLPMALVVTQDLTVTLLSVNPPFGTADSDTAVTIFRDTMAAPPADKPFIATPRVFLNPANPLPTDVAVEVENVSFIDADTATGVVPTGTPANSYDLVLVNPDGSVGLLSNAYRELAMGTAPPVILTATPSSIPASTGQVVILTGTNFDMGAMVTLQCVSATGMPVPAPTVVSMTPVCNGADCTQSITIDGSTLAAGDVCVVRVTNSDGSYGEYSAIGVTTPSLNLNSPVAGTIMNTGRRALSAASGNATPAARFVYALGGDSGQATGAFDTTEFAPVDLFGKMGAWTPQRTLLGSKRTLAGAATVGRYIYLVGGNDGAGPVQTAERALILSPREAPVIEDVDLALGMVGPDPGEWHYRVSAIFDASDTDIPGGESLASDPFTLRIPVFTGKKIAVTLVWKAPVDSLDMPVQGVAGYRIYRSPIADGAPGSEVLLATINNPMTVTFTDDGTATPGTETPLPAGSTGTWYKLPDMGTRRSGVAVAAGTDPAMPDAFYVYALQGLSAPGTAETSYEYLPVLIAPNGRQTAAGAWTDGAQQSSAARWQHGAWVATSAVSSLIPSPDTYVYIGGGLLGNNTLSGAVDAGKISAGGDLGAFSTVPKDFTSTAAGYGVCAANGQLFVFGGANGGPSSQAKSAQIVNPIPSLAMNGWNNEGLSMTHGRYLMGSTVQSAFIFLLGGQTDEPSAASQTTELVIW